MNTSMLSCVVKWIGSVALLAGSMVVPSASQFAQEISVLDPAGRFLAEPEESLVMLLAGDAFQVGRCFGAQPLAFERNDGQVDTEVKFLARGPGYHLFLTQREAVMVLSAARTSQGAERLGLRQSSADLRLPGTAPKAPEDWRSPKPGGAATVPQESPAPVHVLRMRLVGANPSPSVRGEEELRGKVNYFIGNEPSLWRTNLPTFARMRYEEVYPGIDLVYYGKAGQLEYDFIVAPGADPNMIALEFDGAEKLELDERGDLIVRVTGQEVRWRRPKVFQENNGKRQEIVGAYRLGSRAGKEGTGTIHSISFQLAAYDPALALVIDPVLVYSTLLGGDFQDGFSALATDSHGNLYAAGGSGAVGFPTKNPVQGYAGGEDDGVVTKFSPNGELLYSTYLGGTDREWISRIAVDSSGSAYVTGWTRSIDFPTINAIQPNYGGGSGDVFIAKLSPDGSALTYSTYLGGSEGESAGGIAVDSLGNAVVVGGVSGDGPGFPITNALQSTSGGAMDAFITKLDATGTAFIYSTFLGGSGGDSASGVVVDSADNAYVVGWTTSTNLVMHNPIQPTLAGRADCFVVKLNPDGSRLLFSTYIGGSQDDTVESVSLGPTGDIYVSGWTFSSDFPLKSPFQAVRRGGMEVFLFRLSVDTSTVVFSTYLGGSDSEFYSALAVDAWGNVYLGMTTASRNLPTKMPLQSQLRDGFNAYVATLSADGSQLLFGTYFGGAGGGDNFGTMTIDGTGNIYLAGWTGATDFPLTNALQIDLIGPTDAYLVKLSSVVAEYPSCKVERIGAALHITWPASASGFALEAADSLSSPSWTPVTATPVTIGDQTAVTVGIAGQARFYRLHKP